MEILTAHNLNFYSVTSLMQKAIRRGDIDLALKATNEISINFPMYISNRVPIIVTEDTYGLICFQINKLVQENKALGNKLKRVSDEEKESVLKEIRFNNLIMVYTLVKSHKNRDIALMKSYELMYVISDFANNNDDNESDYLNNLTLSIIKAIRSRDALSVNGALTCLYFAKEPSKKHNDDTMVILKKLINFIVNLDDLNYSKMEKEEVNALLELHNYKYKKIALKDRHIWKSDDSLYIILRIGFILCKIYDINYKVKILDEDFKIIKSYIDIALTDDFNIPLYATDDYHNKKISRVDFNMREMNESQRLVPAYYSIKEANQLILEG